MVLGGAMTTDCKCLTGNWHFADFTEKPVGVDETDGRFADVSIQTCKNCHCFWLHYYFVYEHLSRSGRWYRGELTPEIAAIITPQNAAAILEDLAYYFGGGSYYDGKIYPLSGRISG
jgi:hypothetical protein